MTALKKDNLVMLNDLRGQIEAISLLLLNVTAQLEINQQIDGPVMTDALRRKADTLDNLDPAVLPCAEAALQHLADLLDAARTQRQTPRRCF